MIIQAKEGKSELSGLAPLNDNSQRYLNDNASGSRLAVWRMWAYIVAVIAWLLDAMFEKHKAEVNSIVESLHYGTLRWYHRIAMEFQFGDTLIWNGSKYSYAVVDAEKQIIKRAAVVVIDDTLQFKIATLNLQGRPTKLSPMQLSSFMAYMTDMAYPGTKIALVSEDPDLMRIVLRVYYDRLIINPNGSLVTNSSLFPVTEAINGFISNLPFNGRLNIQRFVDAIQSVAGVKDLVLEASEGRYGQLPFAPTGREYIPFAGHMVLDEANSSIQYFAYE